MKNIVIFENLRHRIKCAKESKYLHIRLIHIFVGEIQFDVRSTNICYREKNEISTVAALKNVRIHFTD